MPVLVGLTRGGERHHESVQGSLELLGAQLEQARKYLHQQLLSKLRLMRGQHQVQGKVLSINNCALPDLIRKQLDSKA